MTRPRVEIGIDCVDPFALAPFWEAALGYNRAEGDGHPYLNLTPSDGDGPVVGPQVIDRAEAGGCA